MDTLSQNLGPPPSPELADQADYHYEIHPQRGRVMVKIGSTKVAETDRALVLTETRLDPVFYIPASDVRTDLFRATELHTYCPFRGNASYWSFAPDADVEPQYENIAWSYEEPFFDARRIRGHVAFYADRVQIDVEQTPPTIRAEPTYANPLVRWLLQDANEAASTTELLEGFAATLNHSGIPLWRLWLTVPTLHPQLFSFSYIWDSDSGGAVERQIGRGIIEEERFLESPIKPILEGAGGLRRRLEGPEPQLDFSVVRDQYESGATDYVAMPVVFSDGQINAMTLTTKRAGGFSTRDLGFVYEILPTLARLIEVHAVKRKSVQLLKTYLGRHTGERVLDGHITRGDGEQIHAVIWFCDLRDSTGLASRLSDDAFLNVLNTFYDCVAGAVLDHGGEVLRFIGDAALAIFPIGTGGDRRRKGADSATAVCETARRAATAAQARIAEQNRLRAAGGETPIGYGIALHLGDVTYGNIGTANRLEFTVVGNAANEAARIESLSKTLGEPLLFSESFVAASGDGNFRSLGRHELRGLNAHQEIFTLTR
ncbi:MAG: DUF427 domain-containing protein [Pseudomonadota bacterium]